MLNSLMQSPQRENFYRSLQQYEKKGMLRVNKTQRKNKKDDDIFIDLKNVWHTNTRGQQQQYEAIRSSELFTDQRKVTFVRFNYRNFECKDLTYENIYNKVIKKNPKEHLSSNKIYSKGTMNISELWSEKKLKEVLGNLPFPRDRLKVLKMYPKKNNKLYLPPQSKRLVTE